MKNIIIKLTLISSLTTAVFAGGGGDILRSSITINQLEYQSNDAKTTAWDIYGYTGYDRNKIYIYSNGTKENSVSSDTQNDLVYSHAIAPYWDLQGGIAYDSNAADSNTWAEVALSGLAPYFFETRVALLTDKHGNVGLRTDFEYEALFTQKLIFTPSLQVDSYTKDNVSLGLGKGLSNITLGARLRYEFRREFAPYIGFEWSKNYGNTGKFAPLDEGYAVAGLRMWF